MLPGIRTVTGRVVLTTDNPPAGTAFQGGLPLSPDGAVHATSNVPASFVNGFGTDASGALCVASGVISNYSDGLPRGPLGVLIVDSGVDGPNDAFVGGVRVGTDGVKVEGWGIYMPIWSRYYNVDPTLGANATFTRASTAYVRDNLGIYNLALANEARFEGARRVENRIVSPNDLTNAAWIGNHRTVTQNQVTVIQQYGGIVNTNTYTYSTGDIFIFSFDLQLVSGSATLTISIWNGIYYQKTTFNITTDRKRYQKKITVVGNCLNFSSVHIMVLGYEGTTNFPVFNVWNIQQQRIPTSQLVADSFVDGIKYFDYANGNTVDANGVVTEAQGAAINPEMIYLLVEPAATNYAMNSSVPATHTTGSLPIGAYVCWIEGTGSVAVTAGTATLTGNGTATAGTPDTFNVTVAGTITLTVTGTVTFLQVEGGSVPTSRIYTTTAAVTRAADTLAYSGVQADNETLFTNKLGVHTTPNDWNGTVPVPGTYRSIEVYNPGERP